MPQSAELRRQIEDLALRLVIGESGTETSPSEWMPAVERIRESARRDRADRVVRAAGTFIDAIRNSEGHGQSGAARIASELQEGIARLQQAVDSDTQRVRADDLSPAFDLEIMSDFVLESREHLAGIEAQALLIDRDPFNSDALNCLFRNFHTIKGLAGFLELWELQELAHEVETILEHARNSQLTILSPAVDVILQSADYLRRWLSHLESKLQNQPSEAPKRDQALLARICTLSGRPEPIPAANGMVTTEPEWAVACTVGVPAISRPEIRNESRSVKVDTAKLDSLVEMAGEMVIAESLVRHDPDLAGVNSQELQRKITRLTRIAAELQKTAMAMRLAPIGPLFHRMARLVWDLSRQFGKQVELETIGDDVQLDRTIVEELSDPLMHMVRNAVDHGIETPEERDRQGKGRTAHLLLRAHHQTGQVVIEIADDGRGLDRDKIKSKAIERGLTASANLLSDSEVHNLIFLPGLSTAACITNVSGRGVGMDIVKRHIEKLRGRIEIRSNPGRGTAFLLKLPLTLAIIDGLVVGVGQERYILPLCTVREMFRPAQETIWTVNHRSEMALVRGNLLPVHRLYRLFHVKPRSEDPLQSVLIVAETQAQRFCLMVDELMGKQEVVIKTLGGTFQHVSGIAGGAILGDGRIGLILDLESLFKEKTGDTCD